MGATSQTEEAAPKDPKRGLHRALVEAYCLAGLVAAEIDDLRAEWEHYPKGPPAYALPTDAARAERARVDALVAQREEPGTTMYWGRWTELLEDIAAQYPALLAAVHTALGLVASVAGEMDSPAQAAPERWTFRCRRELASLRDQYSGNEWGPDGRGFWTRRPPDPAGLRTAAQRVAAMAGDLWCAGVGDAQRADDLEGLRHSLLKIRDELRQGPRAGRALTLLVAHAPGTQSPPTSRPPAWRAALSKSRGAASTSPGYRVLATGDITLRERFETLVGRACTLMTLSGVAIPGAFGRTVRLLQEFPHTRFAVAVAEAAVEGECRPTDAVRWTKGGQPWAGAGPYWIDPVDAFEAAAHLMEHLAAVLLASSESPGTPERDVRGTDPRAEAPGNQDGGHDSTEGWHTVTEVGQIVGLHTGTISRMCNDKVLATNGKKGRGRLIKPASVTKLELELAKKKRVKIVKKKPLI